jgi:hypothetical protein
MKDDRIMVGRGDEAIASLLDEVVDRAGGEEELAAKATPEKIAALRAEHVRRYENRLRIAGQQKHTPVNVEETGRLLALWKDMEGKTFSALSEDQRLEVLDALAVE